MLAPTIRSANRRAKLAWRRLRAGLVDTRVSRGELAAAMGVEEAGLPAKVAAFRAALATRLPSGPSDAASIGRTLAADAPGEIESVAAHADEILAHRFNLLGSGPLRLSQPIDWHCDFKSGYRWNPSTHYTEIRFGDRPGVDVKVPWELSRGQHLPLLAQAYLLTGRAAYAEEAVGQIRDWIATNPPEFGVNWVCPMDTAIRAVNWIWTMGLLAESPSADQDFFEIFLAGLLAHGRYLRANLEVMPDNTRTNHYIADIVGLLYLGLCVPEIDGAGEWATFARIAIADEAVRQVLSDGVSYESSIGYHRLVGEMFVSAAVLIRHSGGELPSDFIRRLTRMIEFTAAYLKPNGLAPQIGDADDGRLHILSGYGSADPRDHRHLLAAGAVLLQRDDWYQCSGDRWVESLWLGGAGSCRRPAGRCIAPGSAAFREAGIYVLRSADDVVTFSAGAVGTNGLGNHKHNDVLALDVHLAGEDILVDPGSYLYTSDPSARDRFRSTRMHNTVMIDRVEQNTIPRSSAFSLRAEATPTLIEWSCGETGTSVVAEHDGYSRLPGPVIHRRAVHLRAPHVLAVEDQFVQPAGAARHEILWTFVFAEGVTVASDGRAWLVAGPSGRRFHLQWPSDATGEPLAVGVELTDGLMSPGYGIARSCRVLHWTWAGAVPDSVRFSLHPVLPCS